MIAVISYFIHVFLEQILWKEYNPIITDINSFTAIGAPNAKLFGVFTLSLMVILFKLVYFMIL